MSLSSLALEAENIESRPIWKPMHLQPVFNTEESGQSLEVGKSGQGNMPLMRHEARVVGGAVNEYLFERGLCLPSGTQMTEADLERIVRIIKKVHAG